MGKDSDNNLPVNIKKNHDTFGFVVASHSGFWPGCGGTGFRLVEEILNSIPSVLGYSRGKSGISAGLLRMILTTSDGCPVDLITHRRRTD
jgi:hypothetical protein